ncbi:hypothetical protein NYA9BBAC_00906 [Salinibacterium sp. NYA9b]
MSAMPINTSSYTAKVMGIVVEAAHDVEIPAGDSYSQGFESSVDGWTADAFSSVSTSTSYKRSGSRSLKVLSLSDNFATVTRTLTGLVVGVEYTLACLANGGGSGPAPVDIGITGKGNSGTSSSAPSGFELRSFTFTASATSHEAVLDISFGTAWWTSGDAVWFDDITLSHGGYTEHLEEITEDFSLEVKSAEVTLDETRAPYVQAEITCALPPFDALESIDPRLNLRVEVTATQEWIQPVRDPQTRTFDLLLHERTIDHDEAELTLRLVSDEALLIDAGNDSTSPTRIYGLSVKDAVDSTLTGHGFALEAGALDADLEALPPTLPVITNYATTPIPTLSNNWTGHSSTNKTILSGGYMGRDVFRTTRTSSSGNYAIYLGEDNAIPLTTGVDYVVRVKTRSSVGATRTLRLKASSGAILKTVDIDMAANEWTDARLTFTVQSGDSPYGFSLLSLPDPSGTTLDMTDLTVFTADDDTAQDGVYFNGSTTDDEFDTFAWTGTTNASTSTRTNLLNSDAFIQTPGTLDWDYVAPLVQAGGLRLFCDEKRDWRLVDPLSYSVPGQINVAAGTNATSGRDTISRQQEAWFDSIVIEYRWTDAEGLPQVAYDAASNGGTKMLKKVIERPFPGAGAAASILALYSGRGRTLDVEALTDLNATPGMALVMTLPGTPAQVGVVSSVTWKWSAEGDSDEMRIGSRGLLDTPSTAWLLQPDGYAWNEVPVGQDWTEYETPS